MPERVKTDELDDIIEWPGETVRQTDSSLLDEWEALTHRRPSPAPPRRWPPASRSPRRADHGQRACLGIMARNAMFQRVQLAACDGVDGLAALEAAPSR